MRVLILDDDPSLVAALDLVLRQAGHATEPCDTAHQGRELLGAKRYDAVLIDGGVPGDGRRLWEELERTPEYGGRCILLTGDAALLRALHPRERVFGKPFSYERLLHILGAIGPNVPEEAEKNAG